MLDSHQPFYRLLQLEVTASTNADAVAAAMAGEAEGLVITAERQTAGKGRHGRTWESPAGNLYASILLRPRCPANAIGQYSLAAAVAVAETITQIMGDDTTHNLVQLKWPNDVLISGRKVSGMLVEAAPTMNGIIDWLVVGVGINVAYCPDGITARPLYPPTSLHAEGAITANVAETRDILLDKLQYWYHRQHSLGFAPIRVRWLELAAEGKCSVKLPTGTINGDFAGLDSVGNLLVKQQDKNILTVNAGDVVMVATLR